MSASWMSYVGGDAYMTRGTARALAMALILICAGAHHYLICPIRDWIFVRHIRRLLQRQRISR